MTIAWGDTGRVTMGPLKTLNITPYVSETNITSTALPVGAGAANVPGTPITSFTLNTSTMAPTFTGVTVQSYKSIFGMNVSGQNTSGAAQTVYYQINKNGANYKTGSLSITNNNYWTVTLCDGSLANGDKLDFYIWTPASSGVNYFYQNIFCQPGRVDTGAKNVVNLTFSETPFATNSYFPLTGKVAAQAQAGNYGVVNATYSNSTATASTILISNTSGVTTTIPLASISPTYKLFYTQAGDGSGVYNGIVQSSTAYPYLDCNYQVTSISYRDLYY